MNKLTIIGNLCRDPELRSTQTGKDVCTFTVAVNRRNDQVDYFRVSAWEERGRICQKYLTKGKKVCVIGPVSVSTYTNQNGETKATLEVLADEVEFLSPRDTDPQTGFQKVTPDDMPY